MATRRRFHGVHVLGVRVGGVTGDHRPVGPDAPLENFVARIARAHTNDRQRARGRSTSIAPSPTGSASRAPRAASGSPPRSPPSSTTVPSRRQASTAQRATDTPTTDRTDVPSGVDRTREARPSRRGSRSGEHLLSSAKIRRYGQRRHARQRGDRRGGDGGPLVHRLRAGARRGRRRLPPAGGTETRGAGRRHLGSDRHAPVGPVHRLALALFVPLGDGEPDARLPVVRADGPYSARHPRSTRSPTPIPGR